MTASGGVSQGRWDEPVTSDEQSLDSEEALRQGIVGVITSVKGLPIEGAMIEVRSLDKFGPPIPEIAILSDQNGRYEWPLQPGRYKVSAFAQGYRTATQQVDVEAARLATADFALEQGR